MPSGVPSKKRGYGFFLFWVRRGGFLFGLFLRICSLPVKPRGAGFFAAFAGVFFPPFAGFITLVSLRNSICEMLSGAPPPLYFSKGFDAASRRGNSNEKVIFDLPSSGAAGEETPSAPLGEECLDTSSRGRRGSSSGAPAPCSRTPLHILEVRAVGFPKNHVWAGSLPEG